MDWIEIIQLKPFTASDREDAVRAFGELLSPVAERGLKGIRLFQSLTLEAELTIFIDWQKECPPNGKSGLGVQLARAFSEFGLIYHSAWACHANLNDSGTK